MSVAYLMVALFGLLLLGVPVSVALGISAISALYFFTSYNIIGSAEIMFRLKTCSYGNSYVYSCRFSYE